MLTSVLQFLRTYSLVRTIIRLPFWPISMLVPSKKPTQHSKIRVLSKNFSHLFPTMPMICNSFLHTLLDAWEGEGTSVRIPVVKASAINDTIRIFLPSEGYSRFAPTYIKLCSSENTCHKIKESYNDQTVFQFQINLCYPSRRTHSRRNPEIGLLHDIFS